MRLLLAPVLVSLTLQPAVGQQAAQTPILPPLDPWTGESERLIASPDDPWLTPSEATGLVATPSYEETVAWLHRLAEASADLEMISIGKSGEWRDIWMVVAAQGGATTPMEVGHNGRPTLLAYAGIHSGEIDGKDAGLMLLRDLTAGRRLQLLNDVNFLFIPILNVDGHERSSPYGRINQRGPSEMGWRTNRRNLNLNRDFSKLETPEVQALVATIDAWSPDLYLDLHVTDGADYQYDITFGYNGPHGWSPAIASWLDGSYTPRVTAALDHMGHVPGPLAFGANGRDMEEGNVEWTAPIRFSNGYADARHTAGVLLENHSLKPYKRRVLGTYVFLEASLRALIDSGSALRAAADRDRHARPDSLPLAFGATQATPPMVMFKGIGSELLDSEISGGEVVRWTGEPYEREIPLIVLSRPSEVASRPAAYYIPASWSDIARKLAMHGIVVERVHTGRSVEADMYRLPEAAIQPDAFEGRVLVTPGSIQTERRDLWLAPGSYVVSTDQDLGDLVMLLLEPRSPDSFFQWGYFLEVLQQTEYVEDYVMEPTARKMLEEDPRLREEFETRLAADSTFAASPQQRLAFFYERTPFFDEEWRLYPVGRTP
ncbi:MAG TPA: M14 family metallopeptidase [Rhodothermales bacterium]|nr:M14 family metallopeptidase [Rhodothermales bacterium]